MIVKIMIRVMLIFMVMAEMLQLYVGDEITMVVCFHSS